MYLKTLILSCIQILNILKIFLNMLSNDTVSRFLPFSETMYSFCSKSSSNDAIFANYPLPIYYVSSRHFQTVPFRNIRVDNIQCHNDVCRGKILIDTIDF